ncbi:MAG: glycosyl transferase, group 1 family [Pedosphaera sp.]|nr:glycosyl transferase, group 1 family [Pedosphaera sp.]
MRIALVSKTNGCVGGASYFAENLGAWLLEAGHEVVHYCVEPKRNLRSFQRTISCKSLASRAVRHFNWRARRLGLVEPFPWEYWFGLKQRLDGFDLVHFHDLHMSISPRTLGSVAAHKPVVITVHDTTAFTGGCLYPMGCRRFEENCGQCPQAADIGWVDFTRHNLKQMRRLANEGVNYVFPSKWIQSEARRSLKLAAPASHQIPNGFDARAYRFKSRQEARRLLGIRPGQKVVAFSAASLENKFKGTQFALAALGSVQELAPLAIVIGHASDGIKTKLAGMDFRLTGFIDDREQLGLCYAAADVVIYPSLADNLPITIQEAMAAATPVLAFSVGGVPELVRHNQTGWLVPVSDQDALNRALRRALESEDTETVGLQARRFVADEFAPEQCVNRHVEMYQAALNPGILAQVPA